MKPAAFGIDVGGTKCLGVAIDEHGTVIDEVKVPTPDDGDELVSILTEICSELHAEGSIGLGVPGLVNRDGVLLAAPNITARRMLPLRDLMHDATGLEVHVDNDNTVACLAEWRCGAGRGCDDMLLVGLGTGIGGGFVSGGALQRGHNGFAGEFGHMIVVPGGLICPCGQRGCWERYASGSGLAQAARDAALEGQLAAVLADAGDADEIRGEDVTEAALAGDEQALAVVGTFARWVALGLVNLTNLFDPGTIVLSGGLSADPELFLPPIVASFEGSLFASGLRPRPEVKFAELGPQAGGIGAALLTRT